MKEWAHFINSSPDRERAQRFLEGLYATEAAKFLDKLEESERTLVITTISGSEAIYQRLLRNPRWIETLSLINKVPPSFSTYELKSKLYSIIDEKIEGLNVLRGFKELQIISIAALDLLKKLSLEEVVKGLSNLADVCTEFAFKWILKAYLKDYERLLNPFLQLFAIGGLGKLGGQELNYFSDIDIMFLYSDDLLHIARQLGIPEGFVEEKLSKLVEKLVQEIEATTPDGFLYRVDLRLRPTAPYGPLVISTRSAEYYYARQGQPWERLMLMKLRCIAGSPMVIEELIEVIQPFRYPKLIEPTVLEQIAEMKDQLETTISSENDIKLGYGGIREIEFVIQALQLLYGGKNPFIQESSTLKAIKQLSMHGILPALDAQILREAYIFLRKLEHRIQIDGFRQTHELPTDTVSLRRLATLMGYESVEAFLDKLATYRQNVRKIYESFIPTSLQFKHEAPDPLQNPSYWVELLQQRSFRDLNHSLKMLQSFVNGPNYQISSRRIKRTAIRLIERLLNLCIPAQRESSLRKEVGPDGDLRARWLSDPDRVITRLVTYIERYGARSTLLESWNVNPQHFEMLALLFDRSEFLAELAIEEPDLIENLILTGHLYYSKSSTQILKELRYGLNDTSRINWIRRFHRSELLRIGLRDILGLASWQQSLLELSNLADACLEFALEVSLQEEGLTTSPIAIIGLGKLGGRELNYGSDLDILFVADDQFSDLSLLQKIGSRICELLETRTQLGFAFNVDCRLRPDGEKGLLVNSLSSYLSYYEKRARLWEIQALTRVRHVGGNPYIAHQFIDGIKKLLAIDKSRPSGAWSEDWINQIHLMRKRIESERTNPARIHLSLKTGPGGLLDVEFIAQTYCLSTGEIIPNTLEALCIAREKEWLTQTQADTLISNYIKLRRIEAILRRWSYEAESELPEQPAPLRRVAIRCGFITAEDLLSALDRYKSTIRTIYNEVIENKMHSLKR